MDFLLWHWELLIAGILGCASHWLLFIRGELDRYSVLILSSFMVFYCITFSVFILQEPTLINAALLTTLVSCMFLTSLATSIAVYRLALHRLKHFPGSERDAVTKWSAVRQSSLDNQYHHTLARLHAKFGDYVRTGRVPIASP